MVWKIKNDPGQTEKSHMGETESLIPERPGLEDFLLLSPVRRGSVRSPRGSASGLLERPAGFPSVALSAEAGLYLGEPRSRGVRLKYTHKYEWTNRRTMQLLLSLLALRCGLMLRSFKKGKTGGTFT